ncbi:TetR/AcrR family transcriptional regulator [Streptomyces scabiei]|uniref:HTH-type transcriptional regulator BetI n=1 Tax=Streptomyces scabiei TaxID=1930 RepID=A0A100JU59_STRSC|nr:TetR family transcriptional regulator C-terminal domain-containing protein [Streptomyces scabiei]GAQ65746.1 HTH-type transcriptional regulator BetI [Streptomyces scabiei]
MPRGRFAAQQGDAKKVRRAASGTEDRRDQILSAAADVICERGFADTRIAQIADRAGVSGATIIYHFHTLDHLLVEALQHAEERFYASAEQVVADGATPEERLRRLVEWVFSAEHDNRRLWALWLDTWSQATRHEEVAATRAAQDERWRAMIADIVRELPLEQGDVERFSVGFGAFVDGLTIQVALGDPSMTPGFACELALSYAKAVLGR